MATRKTATTKRTRAMNTGRAARAKGGAETVNVPRSPVALAEAITRRVRRSPNYWKQVQTAMQAAEAGLPFRATQATPATH